MNYLQDRKNKRKKFLLIGFVLFVILFFIFGNNKLIPKLSPGLIGFAVPIWKTEVAFTDVFLKQVFSSKKDLLNQNLILKNRLEEIESQNRTFNILKQENENLKSILLRAGQERFILATILVKPNRSPYGTVIIDVGEDDGVGPDDLVFANGNVVIGEIESVGKKSSKVILYSTPGYISQVTIENTGRYFNAKGRGAGDFEIQFPRDLDVEEGEILLYPSINRYVVGVVSSIIFDPRDSFKKVLFRSAANIQELKWVQVKVSL